MKPQKPSIDGFIPRRADSRLGDRHVQRPPIAPQRRAAPPVANNGLQRPSASTGNATGLQQSGMGLTRRDITESLNSIPAVAPEPFKKRR